LTIGNLACGAAAETATISFDIDVPFPLGVSEISNSADVADDDSNGPDPVPADNSDSDATPIVPNPSLDVSKADLLSNDADFSGDATAGDTLTYTVEITNDGDVEVANVVFNDAPDANTTLVNGSVTTSVGSVTTGNGGADSTVEIDIGNLLFSETATITFDVIINDPLSAGVTLISNQGFASADHVPGEPTDDPDTPQADDSTDTLIGTAPLVDVTKTDLLVIDGDGSGGLSAGDTIEYTVTITNSGNANADAVVFTDTPGVGTSLVVGSVTTGQGSVTTGNGGGDTTVDVDLGVLTPDATVTITFQVMLDDPMPAGQLVISNQGLVTSFEDPSGEPTDDPETQAEDDPTDSPLAGNPDLDATKVDSLLADADGDGMVGPGDILRYLVSITNNGDSDATGVILADIPDTNTALQVGSVVTSFGTVTAGNSGGDTDVNVDIGAVAAGDSVTITFDVIVDDPLTACVETIENQGLISSNELPAINTDDPDTPAVDDPTVTALVGVPDLGITIDDGSVSTIPGGTVSYSLSYSNTGHQSATGVEVTVIVPANTSFNGGASTAGWTAVPDSSAGSLCTFTVGGLAGGGSGSISLAFDVESPLSAGVTQLAVTADITDDGCGGSDPVPADNSDGDTTPVLAAPDLQITKDDGGISAQPGDTVAYNLTYANIGNQNATGVQITDTVPADSSFYAGASAAGWACVPDNSAGSVCTLSAGNLIGEGGSSSVTFAVTVDNPLAAGVTEISNFAEIGDDGNSGPDSTPGDNTDSDTTPVTGAPDLQITKDDGGITTTPGSTVSYTLTYSNVGDQSTTGVEIQDPEPANST